MTFQLDCSREYPESLCVARNWTHRETTPDQAHIESVLEGMLFPGARWLHIGIGNSSLARHYAGRVGQIDGLSISDEEIAYAESLGIPNYAVWLCNKYSTEFDFPGCYDLIIDNNPSSHCCCRRHLLDYLRNVYAKLGGTYLTDKIGLEHAETYARGFAFDEFSDLIAPLGLVMARVNETVYTIRKDPAVAAAENIFGWMSHEELVFLAAQARNHPAIIEIGSFHGRSTKALAATPGVVWTFDCCDPMYERHNPKSQAEIFSDNLLGEIADHKVLNYSVPSPQASRQFPDGFADMVFIDGDHTYQAVKADILAWIPKLRAGGLLCGHDYTHAADGLIERPGVKQAVDEIFPIVNLVGSLWWVVK